MTDATTQPERASLPAAAPIAAAVAGLTAGWVAAGSIGLVVEPLRHALVGTLLAVAALLVRPAGWSRAALAAAAALLAGLWWLAFGSPAVDAATTAVFLAVLARAGDCPSFRAAKTGLSPSSDPPTAAKIGLSPSSVLSPLTLSAVAIAALALWRLALASIPTVWIAADAASAGLGHVAGLLSGRPLAVGPSFAGLDFLMPMLVVWIGAVRATRRPRAAWAVGAAVLILAGLVLHLIVLARANDLAALLPEPPEPPSLDAGDYRPPEWLLGESLRAMLPWNVPVLALLWQAAVAAWLLRRPIHQPADPPAAPPGAPRALDRLAARCSTGRGLAAVAIGTLSVVVLVRLSGGVARLDGAKIVVFDSGQVDWSAPVHGDYRPESAGYYGTLPALVSSFGGQVVVSRELTSAELDAADVLVLLHPVDPWRPGELARIEDYVRRGGSLLVVAGPAGFETPIRAAVNDALAPAGMAVRYDVAAPLVEDWRASLQLAPHPITAGLPRRRSDVVGLRLCSSLAIDACSRPILVGTWGHSEPGSDAAMTDYGPWDPGERLGDLVLLAERSLGRGTVVALADDECLSNLTTVFSYPLVGRILGYLAQRPACPQAGWRQAVGLLGAGAVAAAMIIVLDSVVALVIALAIAMAVPAVSTISGWNTTLEPLGPPGSPRPVAYIDAAHLENYSRRPWSNDGVEGLSITLARNGYLPLALYDWSPARLEGAAAVFALGPARAFSADERDMVRGLVDRGGLFVLCAGATESAPHGELLGELGFRVPSVPQPPEVPSPEPAPTGRYPGSYGRFRTAYLNAADYGAGDYLAYVWLFHAWPVGCNAAEADVLVRGYDNEPLAIARPFGEPPTRGWAVVIGDGGFALNYNTGYYDGREVEGSVENAHFWRWLFSRLSKGEEWIPPEVGAARAATNKPAGAESESLGAEEEETERNSPGAESQSTGAQPTDTPPNRVEEATP